MAFVFPARAGMILGVSIDEVIPEGIPRESGDDPVDVPGVDLEPAYSPRERG